MSCGDWTKTADAHKGKMNDVRAASVIPIGRDGVVAQLQQEMRPWHFRAAMQKDQHTAVLFHLLP